MRNSPGCRGASTGTRSVTVSPGLTGAGNRTRMPSQLTMRSESASSQWYEKPNGCAACESHVTCPVFFTVTVDGLPPAGGDVQMIRARRISARYQSSCPSVVRRRRIPSDERDARNSDADDRAEQREGPERRVRTPDAHASAGRNQQREHHGHQARTRVGQRHSLGDERERRKTRRRPRGAGRRQSPAAAAPTATANAISRNIDAMVGY